MPAFSFKERFVPMVKDGSKPGTIRNFRKHPFKVGTPAHLYFGMRSKFCTKLVEPSPLIKESYVIVIKEEELFFLNTNFVTEDEKAQLINGVSMTLQPERFDRIFLSLSDIDRFAWEDGFRHSDKPTITKGCFDLMIRYWRKENELPWVGSYTRWGKSEVKLD